MLRLGSPTVVGRSGLGPSLYRGGRISGVSANSSLRARAKQSGSVTRRRVASYLRRALALAFVLVMAAASQQLYIRLQQQQQQGASTEGGSAAGEASAAEKEVASEAKGAASAKASQATDVVAVADSIVWTASSETLATPSSGSGRARKLWERLNWRGGGDGDAEAMPGRRRRRGRRKGGLASVMGLASWRGNEGDEGEDDEDCEECMREVARLRALRRQARRRQQRASHRSNSAAFDETSDGDDGDEADSGFGGSGRRALLAVSEANLLKIQISRATRDIEQARKNLRALAREHEEARAAINRVKDLLYDRGDWSQAVLTRNANRRTKELLADECDTAATLLEDEDDDGLVDVDDGGNRLQVRRRYRSALPRPPSWRGYECAASPAEMAAFFQYRLRRACPDDAAFVHDLILHKDCSALPPRRCFARTPQKPREPLRLPLSLFDARALDSSMVRWGPQHGGCHSFDCVAARARRAGMCASSDGGDGEGSGGSGSSGVSNACFDLREDRNRLRKAVVGVLQVKGRLRLGLDVGGGSGSFAAFMALHRVAVVTTNYDDEDLASGSYAATRRTAIPYAEAVALRGLVPLVVPIKARLPFFDNTLDIVHCGRGSELRRLKALELYDVLLEWDRVLRPGGILWLEDFCGSVDEMPLFAAMIGTLYYTEHAWDFSTSVDRGEEEGGGMLGSGDGGTEQEQARRGSSTIAGGGSSSKSSGFRLCFDVLLEKPARLDASRKQVALDALPPRTMAAVAAAKAAAVAADKSKVTSEDTSGQDGDGDEATAADMSSDTSDYLSADTSEGRSPHKSADSSATKAVTEQQVARAAAGTDQKAPDTAQQGGAKPVTGAKPTSQQTREQLGKERAQGTVKEQGRGKGGKAGGRTGAMPEGMSKHGATAKKQSDSPVTASTAVGVQTAQGKAAAGAATKRGDTGKARGKAKVTAARQEQAAHVGEMKLDMKGGPGDKNLGVTRAKGGRGAQKVAQGGEVSPAALVGNTSLVAKLGDVGSKGARRKQSVHGGSGASQSRKARGKSKVTDVKVKLDLVQDISHTN